MTEQDLGRYPLRSTELPHDVESDRNRAVVDVICPHDTLLVDRIAQHRYAIAYRQGRNGAAIVQVQMQDYVSKSRAHVRRISCEKADQAECLGATFLPYQQPEVCAACPLLTCTE